MKAPEELMLPEGTCYLLCKALYGLKQAPREWHICLTNFLQLQGFEHTYFDPCLFYKCKPFCLINIYIDNLFTFAEEENQLEVIAKQLARKFDITDAGP